jgi:uncharacterized membrane protein
VGIVGVMIKRTVQQNLHRLFEAGVIIKGVDGILETLGGVLFLFVSPEMLNRLVIFLTAHELSEDPHDVVAGWLRHAVEKLSPDTKLFASLYLLFHGLIKVFLVAGLLRGKLWAYPTALGFLGAFIVYQVYRFTHTHSPALLGLTVFDILIVFLVWQEYRSRKHALEGR